MQEIISKIKYYNCGYCKNNLKLIFKNQKSEKRDFPAGVFLFYHEKYGYFLYDTGYTIDLYHSGLKGKLYNIFNPTVVKKSDEIKEQLKKDGLSVDQIKYVILSHLHPDHIGCVKYFKNAKIIISKDAYDTYRKNRLFDLIFKELLPVWFEKQLMVIGNEKLRSKQNQYFSYFDLLKDNSLQLMQVDGHAKGQLCCLLNGEIFLGADTSWGNDFVGRARDFRILPRLIQSDMKAYIRNDTILKKMKKDGVKLYFSHDCYEEGCKG